LEDNKLTYPAIKHLVFTNSKVSL